MCMAYNESVLSSHLPLHFKTMKARLRKHMENRSAKAGRERRFVKNRREPGNLGRGCEDFEIVGSREIISLAG